MADALIGATVQVALEMALSLASDRIGLLSGFEEDVAGMTRNLRMIRAVLADADEKQVEDGAVQQWLKSLEGVAFDADNVLDELNYEFIHRRLESGKNQLIKQKVCCCFSSSNISPASRSRMASKIRNIKLKLNDINQEADQLGLVSRLVTSSAFPTAGGTASQHTDFVAAPMVGRADDESKIVEMLLTPSEKVLSVIPVCGMAGLGKTTLAKSIYNNKRLDGHFDIKIWVCVSKKVQIMELFRLILVQLVQTNVEVDNRNVIVEKIWKQLRKKRCFLILDDVWNHEEGLWDDFFTTLKGLNPANASWCLVTTRLGQVAYMVSRLLTMDVEPHFLGRLDDDGCWSILKEKAIAGKEVPKELIAIRDTVIRRCDGLPLAAKIIGGLLSLSAREEWLSIVNQSLLTGDQTGVEQILKVSFDYLSPAPIKKCFAYCSIFPKDTQMERDLLIELWMAEGFLLLSSENETAMETLGDKYLRILLQTSLLEEIRDSRGVCYKMHDLVHDLAELVSKSKSINLQTSATGNNFPVRYLAVTSSGENTMKLLENVSTSLRTLSLMTSISGELLLMFRNLHVLNLSGTKIRELPTTIGKLIHLRLIDLSYSKICSLPEPLCKLYNLQTLRIIECLALRHLPKRLSNLINLRHLHYCNDDANFQMPLGMGRLTCLQTLEFFNIGNQQGQGIEEIGCYKDLKGSLEIRNLELVRGKEIAEKANLFGKKHLFSLQFLWSSTNRGGDNCDEDVLEGLQPHPHLQKLVVEKFVGDQFPKWFMHLSRLVVLELRNCNRCRELPAAIGQLPALQDLKLSGLQSIRCIGFSFYGIDDNGSSSREMSRTLFPALKTLRLINMENLVEWKGVEVMSTATTTATIEGEAVEVGVFSMLETLTIWNCPQLATAPSHFPSLKELRITNNDHVLVVKSILSKVTSTLSCLAIDNMAGLTCMPDIATPPTAVSRLHMPENNNFHNLKELRLGQCPNLTSIRGWDGIHLENLWLSDCENLRELPEDIGFQTLRILTIEDCHRMQDICLHSSLKALQNLLSLQYVTICRCNGLTDLPGEILKSCVLLRTLWVYDCPDLVSFPIDLQQLPSLTEVWLRGCPKLKTNMTPKGFGFLISLRELQIGPFSDDNENSSVYSEFDWSGLISSSTPRQLHLYGLLHMQSLPNQLQYLTNLTSLHLHDFGEVEALPDWVGNLASLQELVIWNCQKLQCLPSMAAMRCLTKLKYLHIDGCPLLKKKCSPQSGPDSEWSKISHVPELNLY